MKQKEKEKILFYLPMLIIMIMSLFIMYHARLISPLFKNNAVKQSIFFLIGITLICLKDKIKINWLFDYSFYFYLFNCFLLLLVLFIGDTTNGARAWFKLGFFNVQPSELMKLFLCLYLSKMTDKHSFHSIKDEIKYILKVSLIIIIPSILVFLEPDTGAIFFYIIISIAIALNSKLSKKWFFFFTILILILLTLLFYSYFYHQELLIKMLGTSLFYRMERIFDFQKGLQIENALIAIGSAPLFQINLQNTGIYIPEAPTDFAFALTSNVFGILGNIILLICYFSISCFLLKIWKNQKKGKMKYFLSGFILMFLTNLFYNILMNIGLLPIMGIPLPLLSYGGSTTIVYFLFLSIILKRKKKSDSSY